jgi:hypothetical protein
MKIRIRQPEVKQPRTWITLTVLLVWAFVQLVTVLATMASFKVDITLGGP